MWTLIVVLGLANLALVAAIFAFYRILRHQGETLRTLREEMDSAGESLHAQAEERDQADRTDAGES